MDCTSYLKKQLESLKNKATDCELVPLKDEAEAKVAARKICRSPAMLYESHYEIQGLFVTARPSAEPGERNIGGQPGESCVNNAGQAGESGVDTASSSGNSSGQPRNNSRSKNKREKLHDSLPRFGPFYGADQPSMLAIKKKAWQHIKSLTVEDHRGRAKEIYAVAVKQVEKAAKESYVNANIYMMSNADFRMMMVKDSCLFLQLVFLLLEKSNELRYSKNDPIFGEKPSRKDIKKWIESMFFVGNQIPGVVLKELLKEKFFQDVITRAKWDFAPSDYCKRAMCELLDLPKLQGSSLVPHGNQRKPSDLLDALYNLVVGLAPSDQIHRSYEPQDDFDLESNEEEEVDLDGENTTTASTTDNRIIAIFKSMGFHNVVNDPRRICSCAKELEQSGISIQTLKSGGIQGIRFERSYYFWANLYLPPLPIDDDLEVIFQNLKTYEISQISKHNREVSSYLWFMSDIAQTPEDVNLLQQKGIVEGRPDYTENLPRILARLSPEDVILTEKFRNLRRKIGNYSSPHRYRGILNIVVVLAVVQTFFTVLAYVRPPK